MRIEYYNILGSHILLWKRYEQLFKNKVQSFYANKFHENSKCVFMPELRNVINSEQFTSCNLR